MNLIIIISCAPAAAVYITCTLIHLIVLYSVTDGIFCDVAINSFTIPYSSC